MKKILIILTMAILLPAVAFAGQPQDSKQKPPQDTTDWLNAPTPDGSPTLKETSDWLAKTLEEYGGFDNVSGDGSLISKTNIDGVRIDNDCSFHYTLKLWGYEISSRKNRWTSTDVSLPLGAVSRVQTRGLYDDSIAVSAHFAIDITTGNLEVVQEADRGKKQAQITFGTKAAFEVLRTPNPTPGAAAPTPPDEMAPHIVNALSHATSLCRSAYKPPAEVKQPF
jgi:hypothetical protein